MKKTNLFLALFLLTSTVMYSQDYLINFTASGASNTIDNIKVENLTQGTNLTINGSDILNLVATITYTNKVDNIKEQKINVYPNPLKEEGRINYYSNKNEKILVRITELSGKVVNNTSLEVIKGLNTINISGLFSGVYSLNIINSSESFSKKIISYGKQNNIKVSMINNAVNPIAKSVSRSINNTVQMQYNDNDILLFTFTSGNYVSILSLIPTQSQEISTIFSSCQDYDNNYYMVTTIGSQTWMAENLKSTHLADGTEISIIPSAADWANIGYDSLAMCWYDNDINNKDIYGGLYSEFAATNGGTIQGACPNGWHMPSDEDWKTLETELGMSIPDADNTDFRGTNQGSQLSYNSSMWAVGSLQNNSEFASSSFLAVPNGGIFTDFGSANFNGNGSLASWWTSTEESQDITGWYRLLNYDNAGVKRDYIFIDCGFGVRCVMD